MMERSMKMDRKLRKQRVYCWLKLNLNVYYQEIRKESEINPILKKRNKKRLRKLLIIMVKNNWLKILILRLKEEEGRSKRRL
jgi:predicted transcriptional regulator